MSNRAVFLDRDGTLNEEVGYIIATAQFRLFDYAAGAVRRINDAGWRAIIITNQSGIARGLYTEEFLAELHATMIEQLQQQGARIDAIYHCPHLPPDREVSSPVARYLIDCDCRKPQAGMLEQAARAFDLDLAQSFVIGDRYGDIAAAHTVGARGVLVLSGHGRIEYETERHQWPRMPDHIAADLRAAVDWVFASSEKDRTG